MTDKQLKRLRRSELLKMILMLRENEKKLQQENEYLKQQFRELSEEFTLRRKALDAHDSLGRSFQELDRAYRVFKKAGVRYRILLEEAGADIARGKPEAKFVKDTKKK